MSVFDREDVSLRQADIEESTLLAGRCSLRADLRRTTHMRFPYMPEELPSAWRLRRRLSTLPASMWEAQDDVWSPVYGCLSCSIPLFREDALLDHNHGNMCLWPTPSGATLQRGQGSGFEGTGATAAETTRDDSVEL